MEKKQERGPIMEAVSSRLDRDLREPLTDFLYLNGVTQAKVVNECIRIGLPLLEERKKRNEPLFPRPIDDPAPEQN